MSWLQLRAFIFYDIVLTNDDETKGGLERRKQEKENEREGERDEEKVIR